MIAKLSGRIDSLGDDWVIIDVGGVGYLVFCSARTLRRIGGPGEAASLHIETHVREDHIHLFGFIDTDERNWFRLLQSVQGVGARVALGILSVLEPDELIHAIAAQDKTSVTRAQGVGPKLAGRIVSELKDKVSDLVLGAGAASAEKAASSAATAGGGLSATTQDAVSALVNLGYKPAEALSAVSRAARTLGPDAGVEALITGGLKELAR